MYKLLKILIVVTCYLNLVNSNLHKNSFKAAINFVENNQTKISNVMQCKIVNVISNTTVLQNVPNGIPISNNMPPEVIRINTTGSEQTYTFFQVQNGIKCASFQIRADRFVHLALSNVQISTAPENIEIVIGYNGNTLIRQRGNQIPLVQVSTPTYLNANEYHGFWVQWTDDHLITVGREFETVPFIQYRSTTPLSVKYFGIQTWSVPGSWILYGNRKCPGVNNHENNRKTEQHLHTESQCWWVPINRIHSPHVNQTAIMILQNQQINILNQLKVEYNIYNAIPKRTRALSRMILEEIKEQYTKAKEIQKRLFERDTTANPQTFDSIIQLFYKFYELIQKDLLKCFQACRH